ncbi:hypothetical protein ACFW04_000768 [Cataglyphis niger]
MAKPERLRFTILEDLILLREVLRQNPYEESDRWKVVTDHVVNATRKNFSLRCVKEHVDHLLKIWAREGHAYLRKSGTEEQYNEKEQLLQQVQDLQREFRCFSKNFNTQKSRMQTREVMENISDTLEVIIEEPVMKTSSPTLLPIASPTSSSSLSSSSSSSSSSILQFSTKSPAASPSRTSGPIRNKMRHDMKKSMLQILQERCKKELEFREKQFCLEERRIQLEEEKFRMEKKEREARLELEIEERRQRISVSKQKQDILEILLQLVHKP